MDQQTFHTADVISNESVGEHVRYLVITPPTSFEYHPGQFFILRLRDANGENVERSYSAANWDDSGQLQFVVRIEEHGQMSSLIDKLENGDQIDIKGPFGRFGDVPDDTKKLILIAGGVGISPIRGILQKTVKNQDDFPVQVFYGFRTGDDFLFQDEIMTAAEAERVSVIPAISEADAEWTGNTGYIHESLEGTVVEPGEGVHAYICGPPPMVKAARQKLYDLGFERGAVHVEAW
ncbi:MAG: FAD-binding oxidoreductase [Candidatus Gracilibacteria bacterium]|nr:FAD-binding oxidoreductase [Candidatus Gracilibacteria bacterium]